MAPTGLPLASNLIFNTLREGERETLLPQNATPRPAPAGRATVGGLNSAIKVRGRGGIYFAPEGWAPRVA